MRGSRGTLNENTPNFVITGIICKFDIMVRTIITPENTSVKLSIPSDYVGRRIEVMYYPVDELIEEKPLTPKNMSVFKGLLSEAEGNELQEYVKKSREEWDRNS
jgi:putative transposon-encoded protein